MKAFVTGATGFVGGNLVSALLQEGHTVVCLARTEAKAEHIRRAGGQIVIDDFVAPEHIGQFLHDCDVVFHVAGVVNGAERADYFNGNHVATRNIVQAISQHSPPSQKVIYISSQAAAGPSMQKDFCESSRDDHPVSFYGESKRAAEKEILAMADQRPVVILRPSIVFGPGDRALLSLFRSARWGIVPRPGLTDMPVNFIYVKDLARAIILSEEKSEADNKIFFVNDGSEYSWSKWNTTLAGCLDRNVISLPIPKVALYIACLLGGVFSRMTGRTAYLNPDKWNEIQREGWLCTSSRIRKELGFVPRWSLKEGITETVAWYRKEGWLSI